MSFDLRTTADALKLMRSRAETALNSFAEWSRDTTEGQNAFTGARIDNGTLFVTALGIPLICEPKPLHGDGGWRFVELAFMRHAGVDATEVVATLYLEPAYTRVTTGAGEGDFVCTLTDHEAEYKMATAIGEQLIASSCFKPLSKP